MEHLSYEDIREYIDLEEYTVSTANMFEQISEHLMECKECARMYQRMLYTIQIVDDFSIEEYEAYLSLEQKLVERYQIEKLLYKTADKQLENRLKDWLGKKIKGIENSIKVFLKDESLNKLTGMIKNVKDNTSILDTLKPLSVVAVRGDNANSNQDLNLSTVLISADNKETKLILDGNLMQLNIFLDLDKCPIEKPPMGVLLANNISTDPKLEFAKLDNGLYKITFSNMEAGQYTLYLDL